MLTWEAIPECLAGRKSFDALEGMAAAPLSIAVKRKYESLWPRLAVRMKIQLNLKHPTEQQQIMTQ